jgi:hypothetical protein
MYEKHVWSSGNMRQRHAELNKSLTTANKLVNPLFPRVKKDEERETETTETEESKESDASAPSSSKRKPFLAGELREKARSFLKKALTKRGYDESLLDNPSFCEEFTKALIRDGDIVSERTRRIWIERAIPEEPPAFVRPGKLKIGDRVQVLNWVPMGVHGTTVDLFPKGAVTKVYTVKCLVTKDPVEFSFMPPEDCDFIEEERVLGLELDGRGPYSVKSGASAPFPYVTKDNTVIIRFPPYAEPGGQTSHVSPMLM